MPENIVNMYLREMYLDDVSERMINILKNGGEDALKKLPDTDASRKMYIKGREAARAAEIAEHDEIKKKFN